MTIHETLKSFICLAKADNQFSETEKELIMMIAKSKGLNEQDVEKLENEAESFDIDTLSAMTDNEKFEYLYLLVQLMKVDGKVKKEEIRFCKDMADKVGFEKHVIDKISKIIFSDPSITSDRDRLMSIALKCLKK